MVLSACKGLGTPVYVLHSSYLYQYNTHLTLYRPLCYQTTVWCQVLFAGRAQRDELWNQAICPHAQYRKPVVYLYNFAQNTEITVRVDLNPDTMDNSQS